MSLFWLFAVAVTAGATALGATGLAVLGGPTQTPNQRSSHIAPTPISGGLGVAAGFAAAVSLAAIGRPDIDASASAGVQALGWIVALAGVAAAIGAFDDVFETSASMRFIALAGVSVAIAVAAGPPDHLPITDRLAAPLPVMLGLAGGALWVFTVMNAVNFIDGVNGLAGGSGALAAAGLAVCAVLAGSPAAALGAIALAGALAGFLYWNARRRARVFMGDAGSLFLGAAFSGLGLIFVADAPSGAVYLPPLLALPILADVLLTLALRARRGERLFDAHRDHAYQRLFIAGRSHLQVAAGMWLRTLAAALAAALALMSGRAEVMLAALAAGVVALSLAWRGDRRWAARSSQ